MKAVLMSIQRDHNANIESGAKTNELRTRPPKLLPPFKVFTYESGANGRHKVVNEWICDSVTTWRICMGVPKHLVTTACVTASEILKYTDNGYKDLTAMHISDLVIYDKPKELSEFFHACDKPKKTDCSACIDRRENKCKAITKPPQSWCYVEI